jgi:hypothetical protein
MSITQLYKGSTTGLFFLIFRYLCWGGGGAKNCPKKYNIDYFGYAANFEVKFKLNFDEEMTKFNLNILWS